MPQYENITKLSHNQTQLLNNNFSQLKMTYMHKFICNKYLHKYDTTYYTTITKFHLENINIQLN